MLNGRFRLARIFLQNCRYAQNILQRPNDLYTEHFRPFGDPSTPYRDSVVPALQNTVQFKYNDHLARDRFVQASLRLGDRWGDFVARGLLYLSCRPRPGVSAGQSPFKSLVRRVLAAFLSSPFFQVEVPTSVTLRSDCNRRGPRWSGSIGHAASTCPSQQREKFKPDLTVTNLLLAVPSSRRCLFRPNSDLTVILCRRDREGPIENLSH